MNTRQAAFQIDPVRGIPQCLVRIEHQALVDLVNALRESVKRTDELIAIVAGFPGAWYCKDPACKAAEAELDQIAADMELALSNQSIEIGEYEQEALGLLLMKEDWPGAAITDEELAQSEMVSKVMEMEDALKKMGAL